MKLNCWEVKQCGRQMGGLKVKELGVCPAATEKRLSGANGGKNGGRVCWALTQTLCGGQVQGTFASKIANCMKCEFYQRVRTEEGSQCLQTKDILALLGQQTGGRLGIRTTQEESRQPTTRL